MVKECKHDILIAISQEDEKFLCFDKTRRYKCQLCSKEILILQYEVREYNERKLEDDDRQLNLFEKEEVK